MDLATIIGLLLGSGLILFSISSNLSQFIDSSSIGIVVGGALGATLVSLPLKRLLSVPRVVKQAFFQSSSSTRELIEKIVRFGEIARRDGILALEGVLEEAQDRFLVQGIQMAVDGSDPEAIYEAMSMELDSVRSRHSDGKEIFDLLGRYAPAFGMIGTLCGLILMLANLDDPDQIAPSMAVALITTLYGAVLANLVALPIAEKLGAKSKEEALTKEIIIQGVMAIQSGDNPKVIEQKLKLFLPPGDR